MVTLLLGIALATACDFHTPRCTCLPPREPRTSSEARQYIEPADQAVVGTVVRIDDSMAARDSTMSWDVLLVTVVVRQRWRGAPIDTLVLRTSSQSSMCGVDFSVGGSYFVLANKRDAAGADVRPQWVAWGCGQSRPASKAMRLRRLLGAPLAP